MPLHSAIIFQSTHPLRGATRQKAVSRFHDGISIHAPLAGCDTPSKPTQKRLQISIHAPLAGCDHEQHGRTQTCAQNFNPRTPCGVRRPASPLPFPAIEFQSTHPLRGATTITLTIDAQPFRFQSTHPLRGATQPADRFWLEPCISIHAPLAGCDRSPHQPHTSH